MKTCTRCLQDKDEADFSQNGRYLRSECKACATAGRVAIRVARGLRPPGRAAQEEPPEKVCTGCGVVKSLDLYYSHPQSKSGRHQAKCKDCVNEYNRRWAVDHPRRAREINRAATRRTHVKRKYGLAKTDYALLVEQAGERCMACGQSETITRKDGEVWPLCVDHDHATGAVRGLLCHACNRAAGAIGDDPARLRLLADYLER